MRRPLSPATPSSGSVDGEAARRACGALEGTGTAVKAYEQVADVLRGRVVAGELEPGARLPTETMLASEFGVSRATVREALQAARGAGPRPHRQGGDGRQLRDRPQRRPSVGVAALGHRPARGCQGRVARGAARGAPAARGARGAARGAPPAGRRPRAPARGDPGAAARARGAGAVRLQRRLPLGRARGVRQRPARDRRRSPSSTSSRRGSCARISVSGSTGRSTPTTARSPRRSRPATRTPPAARCTTTSSSCGPFYEKAWRDLRKRAMTELRLGIQGSGQLVGGAARPRPLRRGRPAAPRRRATTRSGRATTSRSRTRSSTSRWR